MILSLSGACAFSAPPNRPAVVAIRVDGSDVSRELAFTDVHAGQILVAGVWTVCFTVDEADMVWIRGLAARHGAADLVWNERVVWSFGEDSRSQGYFIDRGFNDESTARRLSEEIRSRHGPRDSRSAQQGAAADDCPQAGDRG